MEARVLTIDPKAITLEIEGQLIFQSRYDLLRKGIIPHKGDVVDFKFCEKKKPVRIRILQTLGPSHAIV